MHFALPPRKTSRPAPYHGARPSKGFAFPRIRKRSIVAASALVLLLLFLLFTSRRKDAVVVETIPGETPEVVLVTAMHNAYKQGFAELVVDNRRTYARQHGYAFFDANVTDYDLTEYKSPYTWARIPAMRHAMSRFPQSTYFLFVDETALLTRYDISVMDHIMDADRLESLMIRDSPVVPPDSVIKTLKTQKASDIDFVISQDFEGLCTGSFLVRRGEWAKFLLDAWFDPLYRKYNFQHAERHALEHLVQWHGTILEKLALVPQRTMNSYNIIKAKDSERYHDGDFIAHFKGCEQSKRSCMDEMRPLYEEAASKVRQSSSL